MILVGFSLVAAPLLLVAYLVFLNDMAKSWVGRISCTVLLLAMFGMQAFHWQFLVAELNPFSYRSYVMLQLLTPPAFFFFSREVLVPGTTRSPLNLLHLLPLAVSPFVPLNWVPPLSFVIGAGYSVWFAMYVFGLRRHVHRYAFELFFFCYFAVLAIVMLALAASAQQVGAEVFYHAYATFTGASFVLVVATMIWFPQTLIDISEAAKLAYATTTLSGVDVDQQLKTLRRLMEEERLYENEDLNLTRLAEVTDLTPHQLSELINTSFGHGFSRYVREQRVAAAKHLLQEDFSASVLSVGLSVGFRSQSNFYAAFREIAGESPGAYRKRLQTPK